MSLDIATHGHAAASLSAVAAAKPVIIMLTDVDVVAITHCNPHRTH